MKKMSLALVGLVIAATAPLAVAQKINACGATFPDPIYEKWFNNFGAAHQGVQINYQPNG